MPQYSWAAPPLSPLYPIKVGGLLACPREGLPRFEIRRFKMNILDMRTVLIGHALTDMVCTVFMIFLWLRNRTRFAGLSFWVADYVLQLTAILLIIMRGTVPDFLSMVVSNTMVVTGALAVLMGFERFLGKPGSHLTNYGVLTLFLLVHTYFTIVQPNLAARTVNLSMGILVFTAQTLWLLIRKTSADRRLLTRGPAMVFGGFGLISFLRIITLLVGQRSEMDFFKSGSLEVLNLLTYQMLFIAQTYSLSLLVNRVLLQEVRIQEEKFSKAFHSAPYALVLTTLPDGRILEVNDSFVTMTGFQYAETIGKTTRDLGLWTREEDRLFIIEELAKNKRIQGSEFQFRKKSGESITGLLSAELIMLNNESCVQTSISDITENRKARDIISSRLRLFEFATTHSLEELLQKTLDEVEDLTQSSIGFYHFVEKDQETILLQAWSTRTEKEFCQAEGKGSHYPISKAGVWVDCVYQKQPVIHNDYASLDHRKGMPPGHAEVIRELVVPIKRADKIVAILGVGNKLSDYTEKDIEIVSYLADVAWNIADRKRSEEERARLVFELQETLAKVKTLSGLLPICASCKKIRDDQGYWMQIESYISTHSEAEFSHSFCPDCVQKLYPGLIQDKTFL
jgi:PAS domain S-box-containing protein